MTLDLLTQVKKPTRVRVQIQGCGFTVAYKSKCSGHIQAELNTISKDSVLEVPLQSVLAIPGEW